MAPKDRPPPIPGKSRGQREAFPDPWISEIEGYTPLRVIGEGGAGRVYACEDDRLGRTVAIKVLNPTASKDPDKVERFLKEAKAMARVSSPHVVGIFQVGEHRRGPYIVMEYLEGEDLESRLQRHVKLPVHEALDLGIQCARGLMAAAKVGIVHRDVKPANVIVVDGQAKLTDFGLAKAMDDGGRQTAAGTFVGTAAFIAPERAMGEAGDLRADIYALGASLYALIEGAPPFVRKRPIDVIGAHISDPVPPPKVMPRPVWKAIKKTLEKKPENRYQTYEEMIAGLTKAFQAVPAEPSVSLTNATVRHERPASFAAPAEMDKNDDGDVFKAPAQPTGVMGTLKQMGVIEIVQTLEIGRKNAVVDLEPRGRPPATLAFRGGQVSFAAFGGLTGPEAFFALTGEQDGFFRIHYEREHHDVNIDVPNAFLLLEAVRRADESRAGASEPADAERGLSDDFDMATEVAPGPGAPMVTPRVHPGLDDHTLPGPRDLPEPSLPRMGRDRDEPVEVLKLPPRTGVRVGKGTGGKKAAVALDVDPEEAQETVELAPLSEFADETMALSARDESSEATAPRDQLPVSDHTDDVPTDSRPDSPSDKASVTGGELASEPSGQGFGSDRTLLMTALPDSDEESDDDHGGVVEIRPALRRGVGQRPRPAAKPAHVPAAPMSVADEEDTVRTSGRGNSLESTGFSEPSFAGQARTLIINLEEHMQSAIPGAPRGLPTGALIGSAVLLAIALFAVVVFAVVQLTSSSDPASASALRDELDRGNAVAVIDTVSSIPPLNRSGDQLLLYGHALAAKGRKADALRALQLAGERGAGEDDDAAIAILVDALSDSSPGPAFDGLVVWPGRKVNAALMKAVDSDGWWTRNNAYLILKDRGELEAVDVEAFAVKNLEQGATCRERKRALLLLNEKGRSERARGAVAKARREIAKNACMERELLEMMPDLPATGGRR